MGYLKIKWQTKKIIPEEINELEKAISIFKLPDTIYDIKEENFELIKEMQKYTSPINFPLQSYEEYLSSQQLDDDEKQYILYKQK